MRRDVNPNRELQGYTCLSEEFEASDLVRFAALAEHSGFSFVTVSDHFHPITTAQGHSPFAWSTLGAIAENAKLFSASPHPIDIIWAAGGNDSAQHAAEHRRDVGDQPISRDREDLP